MSADRTLIGSITEAKTIALKGTLFYQACDIVKCCPRNLASLGMWELCHWMEKDLGMRFGMSKFNRVGKGVRGMPQEREV